MADTGWVIAGTGTMTAVSGAVNWNTPNNITSNSDATYAQSDLASGLDGPPTSYLNALNFGFNIKANSIINGVEVRVRGASFPNSGSGSYTEEIISGELIVAGSRVGQNKFTGMANWSSGTYTDRVGGNSTDLWGVSLTPEIINSNQFGFAFRSGSSKAGYTRISQIWMRVFYEEGSGGGVYARDGATWKEGEAYVRDGGIWKPATKYVRDGGVWKS